VVLQIEGLGEGLTIPHRKKKKIFLNITQGFDNGLL
jgi:hypothetical protein